MAIVYASPLAPAYAGATATAGIGGAPIPGRTVQNQGSVQKCAYTFTIPASGPGSANGDQIVIATIDVMGWILDGYVSNGAMGASTTLSVGKLDPNNASNTDAAHYLAATSVTAAAVTRIGVNLPEQVGTDPTGAVTDTGNTVPNFGQANILIVATIGGATPTVGAVVKGVIFYSDRA